MASAVYVDTLPQYEKTRYHMKLSVLYGKNGQNEVALTDPYEIPDSKWIDDVSLWPPVAHGDIYEYLVNTPGPFTREAMKAYKSLDAYNYYLSGWVKTVLICILDSGNCVLKANVRASQRMNVDHKSWVGVVKKTGVVICGHCTCMAGFGEVCSHVAGVLFKVEACLRLDIGTNTCTSLPCVWNQAFSKKVEATKAVDLFIFDPSNHKCSREAQLAEHNEARSQRMTLVPEKPKLKPQDVFNKLYECAPSAAIFTILPGFSSQQTTNSHHVTDLEPNLPISLESLYDPKCRTLAKQELDQICFYTFQKLKVTKEEAAYLERVTRAQSNSLLWYEYRKGRITASFFYEVLRHQGKSYPTSLVKSIMQYYAVSQSVPALKWGRDNEDNGLLAYKDKMMDKHRNFKIINSGLVISHEYPFLGASPDGLVSCDCCGEGLVEIKCPYRYRNMPPDCAIALIDRDYFLKKNENGKVALSVNHKYYHQVQGQMGILKLSYCDFVSWTTKGLFLERVMCANSYINDHAPHFKKFFCDYLLPEILTRNLQTTRSAQPPPKKKKRKDLFCICRKGEAGDMVACDNDECKIEWFHFECVGLSSAPVGEWYCPNCTQ